MGIVDIFFQSAEHSPCFPVYKLCTHISILQVLSTLGVLHEHKGEPGNEGNRGEPGYEGNRGGSVNEENRGEPGNEGNRRECGNEGNRRECGNEGNRGRAWE